MKMNFKMRKNFFIPLGLIAALAFNITSCSNDDTTDDDVTDNTEDVENIDDGSTVSNQVVVDVDPTLFFDNDYVTITTVPCTLSDGTETDCYQIVSKHTPTEHEMGPWCPETIDDGPEKGGLWITDGVLYDLDGDFIQNLATFYGDAAWKMYDDDGNVLRMETQLQCEEGADPNIDEDYMNICAQCLPEWVEAEVTYLIPITPVKQETPKELSDGPTLEEPGVDYGPAVRGLAFNGVRFDHPADIDIILAGYQVAPVDNAGGHVNNGLGYHYHGDMGAMHRIEQEDGHAAMIGYALDAHGIYAQLDTTGNEPTDLDECRGHYDDTRGYHYHVMPLANNEMFDCFYGAYVAEEEGEGGPGPGGAGGPPQN